MSKNQSNSLNNMKDSFLLDYYFNFLKLKNINWSIIGNFESILESFLNNKGWEILHFLYERKDILQSLIDNSYSLTMSELVQRIMNLTIPFEKTNNALSYYKNKQIILVDMIVQSISNTQDVILAKNIVQIFQTQLSIFKQSGQQEFIFQVISNSFQLESNLKDILNQKLVTPKAQLFQIVFQQILMKNVSFNNTSMTSSQKMRSFKNINSENQSLNLLNRIFNMKYYKLINMLNNNALKSSEKVELIHLASLVLQAFRFTDNYVNQMIDMDVLKIMKSLFEMHPNNNILHTQIVQFIEELLKSKNKQIMDYIFKQSQFIEDCLQLYKSNHQKKVKQGFVGHLVLILSLFNDHYQEQGQEISDEFAEFIDTHLRNIKQDQDCSFYGTDAKKIKKMNGNYYNIFSLNQDQVDRIDKLVQKVQCHIVSNGELVSDANLEKQS